MAIIAMTFSWQNVREPLVSIRGADQVDGFIMSSNCWDEIKLDTVMLPQFSPVQKERLRHAGFLG